MNSTQLDLVDRCSCEQIHPRDVLRRDERGGAALHKDGGHEARGRPRERRDRRGFGVLAVQPDEADYQCASRPTNFLRVRGTYLLSKIAALQLVEQGKITLDTPVETVLPELANPVVVTAHDEAGRPVTTTPAKGKITLGQLLNHTSGLDYALDGTTPTTGATLGEPFISGNSIAPNIRRHAGCIFALIQGRRGRLDILRGSPGQCCDLFHTSSFNSGRVLSLAYLCASSPGPTVRESRLELDWIG